MDESDFRIERLILKIGNVINRIRDDDLVKYNLTSAQSETILFYNNHKGESIKELASTLKISQQAAKKLVDKLVLKGILEKSVSGEDKRYCKVSLTKEGTDLCDKLMMSGALTGKNILEGFSEKEKKQLYKFLERIGETINR